MEKYQPLRNIKASIYNHLSFKVIGMGESDTEAIENALASCEVQNIDACTLRVERVYSNCTDTIYFTTVGDWKRDTK